MLETPWSEAILAVFSLSGAGDRRESVRAVRVDERGVGQLGRGGGRGRRGHQVRGGIQPGGAVQVKLIHG